MVATKLSLFFQPFIGNEKNKKLRPENHLCEIRKFIMF